MKNDRARLNDDLRKAVREADESLFSLSEEVASSDSAPKSYYQKIWEAIDIFLLAWDKLDDEEHREEFPYDYLRQTICHMIQTLGPEQERFGDQILSTLQSVETIECRRILLEFLPGALFVQDGNIARNQRSEISDSGKSKKKKLISALKQIFDDDNETMVDILHCLSNMEGNQSLNRRDVFHFVEEILPNVPENNLHIAIQALIHRCTDDSEARAAVDASRVEFSLLEKTDISDMASLLTVMNDTVSDDKEENRLFVESYISILEEFAILRKESLSLEENTDPSFSTFDLVFMILAKRKDRYCTRIEKLIKEAVITSSALFMSVQPSKFVELTSELNDDVSRVKEQFFDSLIDLVGAILCVPLRTSQELSRELFLPKAREFVIQTVVVLPKKYQKKLICDMIRYVEGLFVEFRGEEKSESAQNSSNEKNGISRQTQAGLVCNNIYAILVAIHNKKGELVVPYYSKLAEHLKTDALQNCLDDALIRELATLFVRISNSDNDGDLADPILICRTLLFSPALCQSDQATTHRRIRGLTLANAILAEERLDSTTVDIVWNLITKALYSPSNDIPHPWIALQTVKIIQQMHRRMQAEGNIAFEPFDEVTRILTRCRVVRYLDRQNNLNRKFDEILEYSSAPLSLILNSRTASNKKFRKMYFCFDAFFKSVPHEQLCNWKFSCLFIYSLINSYLIMGRKSTWIANAWVEAEIQFCSPSFGSDLQSKTCKDRLLLKNLQRSFVNIKWPPSIFTSEATELEKAMLNELKECKKSAQSFRSICQFSLSLLLGLSASIAVFCNVWEHFRIVLGSTYDPGRKEEGLLLLLTQLYKIYDLKNKCEAMQHLFRSLRSRSSRISKKRKRKRNSGLEVLEAEVAENQIEDIINSFFFPNKFIPTDALWECLTDSSHNSVIMSALDPPYDASDVCLLLIHVRRCIADHLSVEDSLLPYRQDRGDVFTILGPPHPDLHERLVGCLRFAAFVSLKLQVNARIENTVIHSFISLTVAYFRFLRRLLILKAGLGNTSNEKKTNEELTWFFSLYLSVLGSQDPSNVPIVVLKDQKITVEQFKKLANSFHVHLQNCHIAVAIELLDTLYAFSLGADDEVLQAIINFDWEALNFRYRCDYDVTNAIPSLDVTRGFVYKTAFCHRSALDGTEETLVWDTAFKLIGTSASGLEGGRLTPIILMYRHLGLLAMSPHRTSLFTEHFGRFFVKLKEFLNGNYVPTIAEELSASDDDGDETIPSSEAKNQRRIICSSCDFHYLTTSTYSYYFDSLLKMTASSFAFFSIRNEAAAMHSESNSLHPFYKLANLLELYGDLIVLYEEKFQLFPRQFLSCIINTSKAMLIISQKRIEDCVVWRRSRPVLSAEDIEAGADDFAAAHFLNSLLAKYESSVLERLMTLCTKHIERKSRYFGRVNLQKLRPLQRRVQKCLRYVEQLKFSFRIDQNDEDHDDEDHEKVTDTTTRLVFQKNALQQENVRIKNSDGHYSIGQPLSNKVASPQRGENKRLYMAAAADAPQDFNEDEESFDDFESSSASSAFGVSGNWGENNESDRSESSNSSRLMPEIRITK